jgi:hypothetical protein
MSYGIFRIEKRQIGAVKGIELENNRSADHPINLPRSNVHWELTKYNEKIIYSPDFVESINKELDKYGLKERKNSVVMVDAYYGASPEYFESHSKEEWRQYFLDCLEFHQREFGHVFNAVIHVDEDGGNHLHVVSVPILDRGEGKYSLSARDLLGEKTDFHKRQDRFYEEVSSRYDLERGVIREDGARRKHLDVLDYKKQQREIEIQQQEEQIEKQQETIETKQAEISEAEQIKEKLETEIGKLNEIRELVRPLPFSVAQLFRNIGDAVKMAANNLFRKIENMETIFVSDLRAALCKMRDIGKRMFTPETISGRIIFITGRRPLYQRDQDGYHPAAIEYMDGSIRKDIDRDEWAESFPRYERWDFSPDRKQERDIIERIEAIRDIACGKPLEIDQLRQEDEIEVREIDGEWKSIHEPDQEEEPDYYEQIEKDQQRDITERSEEPDEDEQQDTDLYPPEMDTGRDY